MMKKTSIWSISAEHKGPTASESVKEMGCASGAATNASWTAVVSKAELASLGANACKSPAKITGVASPTASES
jgi:hypothetical protein